MTKLGLAASELEETNRHNLVTEAETNRSNLANEMETKRNHLMTEGETSRSNQARELETARHNREEERIKDKINEINEAKNTIAENFNNKSLGFEAQKIANDYQINLMKNATNATQAQAALRNAQTKLDELKEKAREYDDMAGWIKAEKAVNMITDVADTTIDAYKTAAGSLSKEGISLSDVSNAGSIAKVSGDPYSEGWLY